MYGSIGSWPWQYHPVMKRANYDVWYFFLSNIFSFPLLPLSQVQSVPPACHAHPQPMFLSELRPWNKPNGMPIVVNG